MTSCTSQDVIVHADDIFVQRRSTERAKKASGKTGTDPKAEAVQSAGGAGSETNRKTN
jgi:hypothetical protein